MQGGFVQKCSTQVVALQALRNHPQEDAQHPVEHRAIALHEVAQPLGHTQNPLAHRRAGEDGIGQVRCGLHHPTGVARGAHARAFAGEGHEVVMRAVSAEGACKAVGEDAAFQILGKRLANIGLGVR